MSRLIAAAILVMLWTAVVVAGAAAPSRTVNLNKPGALEALQQSNPTHYEKVRKILDGILQQPAPLCRRRSSLDTDEFRRAERKLYASFDDERPSKEALIICSG